MTDGVAAREPDSGLGLAFLAVASGSADVIAFLMLGHVFASAMTGNTALLGIAVSQGDMVAASQPVTALIGFIAGAVLAAAIYNPKDSPLKLATVLRTLLLLEILCLGAFAALWQIAGHPSGGPVHYSLILLCSVAMGVQGVAAKRINAPGVNTIVFTSTVVAIVLSTTEILLGRVDGPVIRSATKRQAAVFGAYGAGALIAGLLIWSKFPLLVWMPVAAVTLSLVCYELAQRRAAL
ncbi:MAG: YoaK family protein [Pseudomonadota bacterium]